MQNYQDSVTTVTTKGQVVIPKHIREKLGIKPSDKLRFKLEKGCIMAEPVMTTSEAFGFIKTNIKASQADYEQAISTARKKKHEDS